MTTCYAPGVLRAYLDGELSADEAGVVAAHVAACESCEARLSELRQLDSHVRGAFPSTGDMNDADVDAAYAQLRARLGAGHTTRPTGTRPIPLALPVFAGRHRRPAIIGAAVAAALLIILLVPATRSAADSLLSVFRGQHSVFVSVPQSRVQQLENLKVDPNTLFLSKPAEVGTAPAPRQVSSPAAAAPLLGFTPAAPISFPSAPTTTTYSVEGQTAYTAQVNVQTLRVLLASLGVTDVKIPDALGSRPISIILPPVVQAQYHGANYNVTLIEGTSPIVNLPDGVDLSQLGRAVLEVYGMSPKDAATLSKQIDWRSTLVFPYPLGTNVLQQVNVNGAQAVLLTAGGNSSGLRHSSSASAGGTQGPSSTTNPRATAFHTMMYWQQGSRFYILDVQGGFSRDEVVELASSVR